MKHKFIIAMGFTYILTFMLTGCICLRSDKDVIETLPPGNIKTIKENYLRDPDCERIVLVNAVGKGLAPESAVNREQAIIMAERAAIADGYRKLSEKINGVYVEAYMNSGNGAVNSDVVHLETESWLRGTEILEIKRCQNGITEAYVRARILVTPRHILFSQNIASTQSSKTGCDH